MTPPVALLHSAGHHVTRTPCSLCQPQITCQPHLRRRRQRIVHAATGRGFGSGQVRTLFLHSRLHRNVSAPWVARRQRHHGGAQRAPMDPYHGCRQTQQRRRRRQSASAKAASGKPVAASSTARPASKPPRRLQTFHQCSSSGRRRLWKTASGALFAACKITSVRPLGSTMQDSRSSQSPWRQSLPGSARSACFYAFQVSQQCCSSLQTLLNNPEQLLCSLHMLSRHRAGARWRPSRRAWRIRTWRSPSGWNECGPLEQPRPAKGRRDSSSRRSI